MAIDSLTAETIRELRRRLGLTQAAFAVRLNERVMGLRVNQITVSRWERGTHKPSGVAAAALQALSDSA